MTTPTPVPTTEPTTTSIAALPDFSSLFGFDQRVSTLENEMSQFKQADHSAQLLESVKSQIPTIIDDLLSIKIRYATRTALQSYTKEFEKKAQEEMKLYIDVVKKSVKDIIKDEVKSQLPQILPKEVSDFATPLDKDLFDSYGKMYSLKKGRKDKDKDEDPPAGPDQGLNKRKTSKDSAQAEEPVFEIADTKIPQDQGDDTRNTKDQPNIKEASKHDWFKKPERRPAFNLLKGTCKSRVELEFHFEECYKAVTDKIDWTNPEGHEYPFDPIKPLPLIEDQGRQVVPANYFFNNDLEYLKGGSLSRKYTTSTTKTKAVKYNTIEGIEDMVPSLWSLVKVACNKYVTHVKVVKKYDYGHASSLGLEKALQFGKGLMHLDELYKFYDGTLSSIQRVLHDIASNLEMDYLPKRRWSKLDRKRSCIMIKEIDQQLFKRRLMRNLEKFVRGREYGNDFKLFERTI
ncbi:hypothetical protein Tco_0948979 [Tanacetum coccineum]